MNDDELTRKATEAILEDAKRGAEREKSLGVYGWKRQKCKPNRLFLANVIKASESSARDVTKRLQNAKTRNPQFSRDYNDKRKSDRRHEKSKYEKKQSLSKRKGEKNDYDERDKKSNNYTKPTSSSSRTKK